MTRVNIDHFLDNQNSMMVYNNKLHYLNRNILFFKYNEYYMKADYRRMFLYNSSNHNFKKIYFIVLRLMYQIKVYPHANKLLIVCILMCITCLYPLFLQTTISIFFFNMLNFSEISERCVAVSR